MEKFVQNCKVPQIFGVSRQILDKISVQLCENLYCLKDNLVNFHYVFYLMKKYCLVLKLCYFKVYNIWTARFP